MSILNRITLFSSTILFPLLLLHCHQAEDDKPIPPVEYVIPFIGTAAYGHSFPGAAQPFGMVQLSPATGATGSKGYSYSDVPHGRDSRTIIGFTHTNVNGTGIGHVAKYAQIALMPTLGPLLTGPGKEEHPESGFRSRFSHENEYARPGYYQVLLEDYGIQAELTSTVRAGMHRYTFPETDQGNIILDITREHQRPELHQDASIQVLSDFQISGHTTVIGWHSGEPMTWYFFAEFSRPFDASGTFSEGLVTENGTSASGTSGVGAYVSYQTHESEAILVRVGISFTGIDGAKKNLREEISHWDFDVIRRGAEENWNKVLGRVSVSGGTRHNKIKFYTALYRSLLFPRVFSDVDGSYYSHFEDRIIQEERFRYYVDFSLWDTYRTSHPLLTILEPERQLEMIETFLAMYDQGGRIPGQVTYRNFYSPVMIGDHGATTIIDTYRKGIREFDVDKAYEAMLKNAYEPGPHDRSRPGLETYDRLGYVAAGTVRETVSKTLEYSHTDWILAQMAREIGDQENYLRLLNRARQYKQLYDDQSGFYRPKYEDGSWVRACENNEYPQIIRLDGNTRYTHYDCWNPWWIGVSPHRHYTEGNAFQNLFYPQHDIHGLIDLMGGRKRFVERLDGLFYESSSNEGPWYVGVTGAIGQYVQGNQPSHHKAFLYNYAGAPWKTQSRVRGIIETLYGVDEWGLPGNEDMGQMSAWLVFSAMGLYPVTPGDPYYTIASPLFEKITIDLGEYYNHKTFTILAKNASGDHKFIQSAKLNGTLLDRTWISHEELVTGGTLEFVMDSYPNYEWAASPDAAPPGMSFSGKP